jgi:cephalosporin hydroxylase
VTGAVPGRFIAPDPALADSADPAAALGIVIRSGYRAIDESGRLAGASRIFDTLMAAAATIDLPYEDQCSAQYYFDLVRTLRDFNGEFDRVVEVGVYLGGSSTILAGCMAPFGFALDLVDIDAGNLQFAHERARRVDPAAAGRMRLFHGDLPAYVRAVMLAEPGRYIVHHDGDHRFDQVVRDMAALSFVQDRLVAIIAQDTHLRGRVEYMNFVDMALYAVFGLDLKYAAIGTSYAAADGRTAPDAYYGNYFVADAPEGFVLPMALNRFRYTHPAQAIADFLPPAG